MTDYSKIDFTQLELEPIGVFEASVKYSHGTLFLAARETNVAYLSCRNWRLTSGVSEFDKRDTDELWARTEQVDEFIKQRSRRRVTTIQLVRELIDNEREICVQARYTIGAVTRYRFNRSMCRFEFYDAGCWHLCTDMGDSNLVVTIID